MNLRQCFRELHETPFIIPNPWDAGSARILASLGFQALATTSGGHAATLGRADGNVTRDEAMAHARAIVGATALPVSADLENGFGDDPQAVAETIVQADATGLAGCSIEDYSANAGLYEVGLATARVRAAVEAAAKSSAAMVLTARAENHLRGNPDLADTIARLQAYQEAGADVLYAPGLVDPNDIGSLCSSVDRPVNVLILPGGPTAAELFAAGAKRVSLGSALNMVANAALVEAANELQDKGTHTFWTRALGSAGAVAAAFASDD
jgi:2-methylisocitrate lyase-like PEP mutase family enzyme